MVLWDSGFFNVLYQTVYDNHSAAKCIVIKLTKLIGMAYIGRKNGTHDGIMDRQTLMYCKALIEQNRIEQNVCARDLYNYENSAKAIYQLLTVTATVFTNKPGLEFLKKSNFPSIFNGHNKSSFRLTVSVGLRLGIELLRAQ